MDMLQGVWKQHLRPCAVVGYGVEIFLPSPPNYVTRSPGAGRTLKTMHSGSKGKSLKTLRPYLGLLGYGIFELKIKGAQDICSKH